MYQQSPPHLLVSRASLLSTPGRIVIRGDYIQTDSPTLSSRRVRWVQLAEWATFSADFRTFWDSLPAEEKNQTVTNKDFLTQYKNLVINNLQPPTNEDMLSAHLDAKYTQLHTWTTEPPLTYNYAKIIRRDDGYQTIGKPDYLLIDRNSAVHALYAVMELKTFWKVSSDNIMEVLYGNGPYIFPANIGKAFHQICLLLQRTDTTRDDWQWNKYMDTWYATRKNMAFSLLSTVGSSSCGKILANYR